MIQSMNYYRLVSPEGKKSTVAQFVKTLPEAD